MDSIVTAEKMKMRKKYEGAYFSGQAVNSE
jgi:hypothetical protein